MHNYIILSTFFLFFALSSRAQDYPNNSVLKLEEIMKGNEFIGHQPTNIRWTMDGKKIVFDWNRYNQVGSSTYAYDVALKKMDSVTPEFYLSNAIHSDVTNGKIRLFSREGNLYSYNITSRSITPILENNAFIHNVQYSPVAQLFYFQIEQSLYSFNPNTSSLKEVVKFEKGSDPEKKELSEMETKELELFEFHQLKEKEKEWWEKSEALSKKPTRTIHYTHSSVSNIQISGDGNFITFRVNDNPKTTETHVENHIAKDGHTYTTDAREKVGHEDANHQLGIYDLKRDTVYYVNFSELKDIRKKPSYLNDAELYDTDRKIVMHRMIYAKNGLNNVLDVRSYDNKDRWIVSVDLAKGTIRLLDHQHDDAWIGGPGISEWNMSNGTLGFLDNETVYFQSEETGFSALYELNVTNSVKKRLTGENYEIHDVQINPITYEIYVTANKMHPGNREVYQLKRDGSMLAIWTNPGYHELFLSPTGEYFAQLYSYRNQPWELFVSSKKKPSALTQITHSTSEAFKNYNWYDPQVIALKTENGDPVYTRVYTPEDKTKNGAAIIFVHGAGYLQNAHNYWSTYYREYMFHNLLRDNGFTIIDIDYRASEGYGRDHRTAIYRHMGGADLQDQLIGRQFLIDSCGIDSTKIGIYGGSYGGFMTLMALLTQPGKFKAGAALRSVTDWSHYNHEYTSNILNYPATDPEAYRKSSPIYYAENLSDRLIMLHGMVDDNVQFQDVVRLSQRFIELGKTNWELAVYPVEAHGFKITSSWIDEYRRIYNLFCEELITK